MTERTVLDGKRLGLNPSSRAALDSLVYLRVRAGAPAIGHPTSADHLSAVPGWMLGGNDRFGTCGPTSVANYLVLQYLYLTGEVITVADEDVFDLYRRSGNPEFDPATGQGDDGVDMLVMLKALADGGINITHADGTKENVRSLAYAAVPHPNNAIDMLRAVTYVFGGVILAADLKVAQQAQTGAGVWDRGGDQSEWGGHAIPGGKYTSALGAGQPDLSVITWQQTVGLTAAFETHQVQQAFAVVFPVLWHDPEFAANIDQQQLAADYTAATGRPFPLPVPPPPPPPQPVPVPPVPAPSPNVDAADLALDKALAHWAVQPHYGGNAHAATAYRAWRHAKGLDGPPASTDIATV